MKFWHFFFFTFFTTFWFDFDIYFRSFATFCARFWLNCYINWSRFCRWHFIAIRFSVWFWYFFLTFMFIIHDFIVNLI